MVAAVADCHIGNRNYQGGPTIAGINSRGQASLDTFERAISVAKASGAKLFVVAGDLFHYAKPEPAFLTEVIEILQENQSDMDFVIVPGNHDQTSADPACRDTACDPLYTVAQIIHTPTQLGNIVYVPFSAQKPMADYLEDSLVKLGQSRKPRVLITHIGVSDDTDPPWCAKAKDGIHADRLARILDKFNYSHCFVGNFHQHKEWNLHGSTIIQLGTLCPGGFGDAGLFPNVGGCLVFDGKVARMEEVEGPRFLGHDSSEQGPPGVFIKEPPKLNKKIQTPVNRNRSTFTSEDAISQYIDKMTLDGVSEEFLKEQARDYWLKAAK